MNFESKQVNIDYDEKVSLIDKLKHIKPVQVIRRFGSGIGNIVRWVPIIWKDHDWDGEYFSEIILFKLNNMKSFFENPDNTCSVDAPETAKEIDEVIKLLKKVQADNYIEELDPHFNDWLENDSCYLKKENGHCVFVGPKWTLEEQESRREIYYISEKQKQDDLNKAYSLIAKKLRGWWD